MPTNGLISCYKCQKLPQSLVKKTKHTKKWEIEPTTKKLLKKKNRVTVCETV